MMKSKKNFYAIKRGRTTGIFTSWNQTKQHVLNYKNALYKKFDNLISAKLWLKDNDDNANTCNINNNTDDDTIKKVNDHHEQEINNKNQKKNINMNTISYQKLENSLCLKNNKFQDMFSKSDKFTTIDWIRKDYYYIPAICENYYMAAICYWENYDINNRWKVPDVTNIYDDDDNIANSLDKGYKHFDSYIILKSNQKRYMCDKMLLEFLLNLFVNIKNLNLVKFKLIINNNLNDDNSNNLLDDNDDRCNDCKNDKEEIFTNLNLYFTNKSVYRTLKYWIDNKFSIFEKTSSNTDDDSFNFEQLIGTLNKMYHSYCYKILKITHESQSNITNKNIIVNFILLPAKSNSILYKECIMQLEKYSKNNNKLINLLDL